MPSIIKSLRVISDPTRLRLLRLLRKEALTVAELQDILALGQSRASASLAQLKREGLVSDRRVGKNIFYRAETPDGSPLAGLIDAACAEIPEAGRDLDAMEFALRKRKDRAADYFNRLAGKFGRTYIPGRSWQGLGHALLGLLPPMVIADLGAGEGTLSQLLARNAKHVIAIDNSEKMVEFGAALAKEHGFENLEYRLGDIENIPISDDAVDVALFSQALHHAVNPQRAVTEAYRILKPGGRILILDLVSHTYEQARDLYAHEWLGFAEAEVFAMLKTAGFAAIDISVVSREKEAPNFQTMLAMATKPGG